MNAQRVVKKPKGQKGSGLAQVVILIIAVIGFISFQGLRDSFTDASAAADSKPASEAAADIAETGLLARNWRLNVSVTDDKKAAIISMNTDDLDADMREMAGIMTGYARSSVRGVQDVTVLIQRGAITTAFYWSAETNLITEQGMSDIVLPATPDNSTTSRSFSFSQPTSVPDSLNGETYTVTGSARVRSCSSTTCTQLSTLSSGSQIRVSGVQQGESVSGSNIWRIVQLPDGQTGYVHSSLLREGVIEVAPVMVDQSGEASAALSNTSVPATSNTSVPATTVSWTCSGDIYDCDSFSSRGEMLAYYNACPGDPSGLDGRDDDTIPCED